MTPFYSAPERQLAFLAEVYSWLNTPFRLGPTAVKGPHGGVDCVGLCIEVAIACGACKPFTCERLPLDWHHHHDRSAILDFLHQPDVRGRVQMIEPEAGLMNGDMIAVQVDRCVHHLGLYVRDSVGAHLVHVPIGACVQRWALDSTPLAGNIRSVWRIMEANS